MIRRQRSTFSVVCAAVAAIGLFVASGAFATTPTVSDCTNEWEASDAYGSCAASTTTDSISVTSAGECSITSTCSANDPGGTRQTQRMTATETLDNVDDLNLCFRTVDSTSSATVYEMYLDTSC